MRAYWGLLLLFVVRGAAGACEPIRIRQCRGMGYNVTSMPNLLGHETQRDAELQVESFTPLIQYECSLRLRFFLCSVHAPMCTDKVPQPIGPCRPLCDAVRELCEPVLVEFGFAWPAALNCSRFPAANGPRSMCMEGPRREAPPRPRPPVLRPTPAPPCGGGRCPPACAADTLFSRADKRFADLWVAVWATACVLSSLYTIAAFFADPDRFQYPERMVVFLSWCYLAHGLAFVVRLAAGREAMGCVWTPPQPPTPVQQGGPRPLNCSLVFCLLHFSGGAGAAWWALLCAGWWLNAGVLCRRWRLLHALAWLPPAALTVAALVTGVPETDELTGLCAVGAPRALMQFVIGPQAACLGAGLLCLLAGCVSRLRAGPGLESQARTGAFAALCALPAACQLAANIYEYMWREEWMAVDSPSRPMLEVFALKIFMSLVVGITTGAWIYTSRTSYFVKLCPQQRSLTLCNPRVLLLNNLQQKMTHV